MRLSSVSVLALTLAVSGAALAAACGGGSSLDDYEDGVPSVVPAPIKAIDDGDGDDDETGTGKADAGTGTGTGTGKADAGTSTGTGKATIGDGCKKDNDCSNTGGTCTNSVSVGVTITFPNGYCTQRCSSTSPCPTGSSCVMFVNTCLRTCTADTECRVSDGYKCMAPLGTQKYCMPANTPTAPTGGTGGLIGGLFGG